MGWWYFYSIGELADALSMRWWLCDMLLIYQRVPTREKTAGGKAVSSCSYAVNRLSE
jgi:hypothetical protein